MGLFNLFKKNQNNVNCSEIISSENIYPNESISVVLTQTESGKPATGWINLAYTDYAYKKCFPYNLQFSIELDESEELSFDQLEDYFINELKKGCIVHPVARVSTDFGFIMDAYIDDYEFASKMLSELYENKNKLVEFGCGFKKDTKWKEYRRIIRLLG